MPPERPRDAVRLSVVLTNYNHAHFLPRALNAVVHQSRAPDELILVDDASTDDSVAIMEGYARDYPYMSVHRNERNLGCTATQMKALDLVRGDYLQRIASDDYMLPGFIDAVMRCAEQHPGVGIVSTALALTYEEDDLRWGMTGVPSLNPASKAWGYEGGSRHYPPGAFGHLIETSRMLAVESLSPSTVFRTDLVRRFGGWPADLGMHEVSFVLRAAGLDSGMAYVDEPLYAWIYRSKGITRSELMNGSQLKLDCLRHAERMTRPPFDALFSDAFRRRWDADTAVHHIPPERKLSWRSRFTRVLRRQSA